MNIKAVEQLIAALEESTLTSLSYEDKDVKISLEKGGAICTAPITNMPVIPVQQDVAVPVQQMAMDEDLIVVSAPIVGSVYRSHEPGTEPIVSVGDRVKIGETLCLIEAMKMFSEVPATADGIVKEIYFTDGELVEFGAPLVAIGPA